MPALLGPPQSHTDCITNQLKNCATQNTKKIVFCEEIGSIVPELFVKDMWNVTANNPLFFSFQNWMNKEERRWWKRRRKLFASTATETINTVKRGRTSRKLETWLILLPDGFSHHPDIAENWKRRNLSWKWYSWYFQGGWVSVGAGGPGPEFLLGWDHTRANTCSR